MNQTAQQQGGSNVTTVTLGQSVRVMADRINNTMLIYATPVEYSRIEATLKRLDVQRAQVLIEASIVEVTLNDNLKYGLQWAFHGGVGSGRGNYGWIGSVGSDGKLHGTNTGLNYALTNTAGDISAVLSALADKSLVRVISSPSLMVLDNHTANIQVGDQVPMNTGTYYYGTTNNPANSYTLKDTGIMLSVTPSVSAGDLVSLDINQIVTDVNPNSASDATGGNPSFMQRQIQSQVAVRSGETMVLGGLIKDNTSKGSSGVPLLSSIPIIGALFGTQSTDIKRTELLVVLTPRVVRSDEEVRAVSRELRERMRGLSATGLPQAAPSNPSTQGVNEK